MLFSLWISGLLVVLIQWLPRYYYHCCCYCCWIDDRYNIDIFVIGSFHDCEYRRCVGGWITLYSNDIQTLFHQKWRISFVCVLLFLCSLYYGLIYFVLVWICCSFHSLNLLLFVQIFTAPQGSYILRGVPRAILFDSRLAHPRSKLGKTLQN